MKQRSTTPVSRQGIAARSAITVIAAVMAVAVPLSFIDAHRVSADGYDRQMEAIGSQIDRYQAQAEALSKKADTLNVKLKLLEVQRREIEAQLQLTQKKYDQLTAQIAATEKSISDTQQLLGKVITNMWVDGSVTPLEMLASSKNIGDFIDQQAYQNSMQQQLHDQVDRIQQLKTELEQKRDAVKQTLDRQTAQRNTLAAKEQQQRDLIKETRNQEGAYRSLIAKNKAYLHEMSARQRSFFGTMGASGAVGDFSYSDWSGNKGCSGGYPYCGAQDTRIDPWSLYNRECVSYVAWSLSHKYHRYVADFSGEGNAYQWPYSAIEYSNAKEVHDPKPGDAVILPATDNDFAPIGHAMIVDKVDDAGIHVSQYNFGGTGEYSTMIIGSGGVIFLRFPPK